MAITSKLNSPTLVFKSHTFTLLLKFHSPSLLLNLIVEGTLLKLTFVHYCLKSHLLAVYLLPFFMFIKHFYFQTQTKDNYSETLIKRTAWDCPNSFLTSGGSQ